MIRIKYLVLGALLLAATPVFAQDATPPAAAPAPAAGAPPAAAPAAGAPVAGQKIVGVDVTGVLPLGDYSDSTSFAIGAMLRGEYVVNDKLSATLRVGYLYHLGTPSGFSLYMIPIHVGATYLLAPKIFGWAELGLNIIGESVDVMGVSGSTSSNEFSLALGAGYEIMPKVKARVGFFYPGSLDNGMGGSTTLYGLIASVGYDFAAF